MIRNVPIIPTIIVALAVGLMIYLGFWQLDRLEQKEQLLAAYAANLNKPPVSYPELGPVADDVMFRKSSIVCLDVAEWRQRGGSAADGSRGYRYIASCVTSAEGPGALVTIGVGNHPNMKFDDFGDTVEGIITQAPVESSFFDAMLRRSAEPGPMLVATDAPDIPGLKAPKLPSVQDIPNNHLAYAVQWFLFAGIALIIYFIAVRKKTKAKNLPK